MNNEARSQRRRFSEVGDFRKIEDILSFAAMGESKLKPQNKKSGPYIRLPIATREKKSFLSPALTFIQSPIRFYSKTVMSRPIEKPTNRKFPRKHGKTRDIGTNISYTDGDISPTKGIYLETPDNNRKFSSLAHTILDNEKLRGWSRN